MRHGHNKLARVSAILVLAFLTASGDGMGRGSDMLRAHAQPKKKTTSACTDKDLCLDIVHLGNIPVGTSILVVSWLPLSDSKPDDDDENAEPMPKIAYMAPVNTNSSQVKIPLSEIVRPDDAHARCARSCDNESVCKCIGESKIGLAYVALVDDPNADGILEERELIDADLEGLSSAVIAFGQETMLESSATRVKSKENWFNDVIAETRDTSVRAFRWVHSVRSGPDHLEALSNASHAELYTCAFGDARCELRFPNLM